MRAGNAPDRSNRITRQVDFALGVEYGIARHTHAIAAPFAPKRAAPRAGLAADQRLALKARCPEGHKLDMRRARHGVFRHADLHREKA